MAVFRERVVAALGKDSKSMDMIIEKFEEGSAVHIAKTLTECSEDDFALLSRAAADKLTEAQTQANWPGGILVVFKAEAGVPARSLIGIIKAETDGGFHPTAASDLEYISNLFMTRETKLYKIGLFSRSIPHDQNAALPGGWEAVIYDSLMTSQNRDAAAEYFYGRFLGCKFPINSARLTKQFYHATRDFINGTGLDEEKKADLFTSLYTYLKVDQTPTVETATFAAKFLDPDMQDGYAAFMGDQKFPAIAVKKDTSEIQNYLKRRKVRFSKDIVLSASPEAFEQSIRISTIAGEPDEAGVRPKWTQIIVRDRIREQE